MSIDEYCRESHDAMCFYKPLSHTHTLSLSHSLSLCISLSSFCLLSYSPEHGAVANKCKRTKMGSRGHRGEGLEARGALLVVLLTQPFPVMACSCEQVHNGEKGEVVENVRMV
jgi:hypothetical protein